MKLIASTTDHEAIDGEDVMRGDPAALLVGMGRPYESRPRHYHWADRPEHRDAHPQPSQPKALRMAGAAPRGCGDFYWAGGARYRRI